MSVDDALSRMELVGHDFYLFSDSRDRRTVGRLPAQGLRLRRDPPVALTRRGAPDQAERGPPSALRRAPVAVSLPWSGRAPAHGARAASEPDPTGR